MHLIFRGFCVAVSGDTCHVVRTPLMPSFLPTPAHLQVAYFPRGKEQLQQPRHHVCVVICETLNCRRAPGESAAKRAARRVVEASAGKRRSLREMDQDGGVAAVKFPLPT
jgi:hypothetical protein